MQQRFVKSKGKTYLVNVADYDEGVGSGFALGQLVLKSADDSNWYVTYCSGSYNQISMSVSQSALPFTTGPIWTQNEYTASIVGSMDFFEQNFPYQILASNDGNAYAVYLTKTPPNVTVTISQSAWGKAYITNSQNAVIDMAKPNLILQNVTDGNYYIAGLTTSGGVTSLFVNQTMISQSLVHPIY